MKSQERLYLAEPPPAFRDFPPLAAGAGFGGCLGGGAGLPGAAAPSAAACAVRRGLRRPPRRKPRRGWRWWIFPFIMSFYDVLG